jgi:hypothetical protein
MGTAGWKEKTLHELHQAETARLSGNEGKARVCARRAAGHIIGEFLTRTGSPARSPSAISRLGQLADRQDLDPRTREVASHFLLRITPEHTLPLDVDLIAEARWLARHLLGDSFDTED